MNLEVFDVSESRLGSLHSPIIEQTFAHVLTTGIGGTFEIDLNSGRCAGGGGAGSKGGPPKGMPGHDRRPGFGRVVDEGQKSVRMHPSHRGRRAMHTRRPWRMSRSDRPVHSSLGTIEQI